jgi:hypothetical protein
VKVIDRNFQSCVVLIEAEITYVQKATVERTSGIAIPDRQMKFLACRFTTINENVGTIWGSFSKEGARLLPKHSSSVSFADTRD